MVPASPITLQFSMMSLQSTHAAGERTVIICKHRHIGCGCLRVPCVMISKYVDKRVPSVKLSNYVESCTHNRWMFTCSVCNVQQLRGRMYTYSGNVYVFRVYGSVITLKQIHIIAECLRVPCVKFSDYVVSYTRIRWMFTCSVYNVPRIRRIYPWFHGLSPVSYVLVIP